MPLSDPRDDAETTMYTALAIGLGGGNASDAILAQESRGQQQILTSAVLPTDMGDRAEYEALGFTFGDPVPGDPMFTNATLPRGWSREGSDHAMWSYLVDADGNRRASIFYKAAFYDRSAHMSLNTVYSLMYDCVYNNQPPTLNAWVTREAAVEALTALVERFEKDAAEAATIGGSYAETYGPKSLAQAEAARSIRDQIASGS
jgi:hypothetical protein